MNGGTNCHSFEASKAIQGPGMKNGIEENDCNTSKDHNSVNKIVP